MTPRPRSTRTAARHQLAAGIAHDFNNTLSVIALEAELQARVALERAARV